MFVHDYSNKEFEDYEDCREDLMRCIESDDIVQHFGYSTSYLIFRFLTKKNNQEFIAWLEEEINSAYEATLDELITEYDEGEV